MVLANAPPFTCLLVTPKQHSSLKTNRQTDLGKGGESRCDVRGSFQSQITRTITIHFLMFTGEWFTNHSNHIHIFTPITRMVATKVVRGRFQVQRLHANSTSLRLTRGALTTHPFVMNSLVLLCAADPYTKSKQLQKKTTTS